MKILHYMNKLNNVEESILYLSLKAHNLLKQQGCEADLLTRYIDDFGLCFVVFNDLHNKMLIRAGVFFDLAEENMLTIENIKRNSI